MHGLSAVTVSRSPGTWLYVVPMSLTVNQMFTASVEMELGWCDVGPCECTSCSITKLGGQDSSGGITWRNSKQERVEYQMYQ